MARTAYGTVGRYRHGLWLVAKPNGQGIIVNRAHLPVQGTGYRYYWLGANQGQVSSRISDAISKLGVNFNPDMVDLGGAVKSANRRGYAPLQKPPARNSLSGILGPGVADWITQNWPFLAVPGDAIRGGGSDVPPGDNPQFFDQGTNGSDPTRPRDNSGDSSTSDSSSGDSSGKSGLGYAGKAGILGATAFAISSPLDFLKFIAWIFHPRNILRMVEFLVGIALMAFGLHAVMQARSEGIEGFTTSEGALTRSGLGRVASELGAAARREGGGSSGRKPRRPRSAPHTTRRRALRQRYEREENLSRRKTAARRKSP